MTEYILRDYQQESVDETLSIIKRCKHGYRESVMVAAATGAGKSIMAAATVKEMPKPALVLAPTELILKQLAEKIDAFGMQLSILDRYKITSKQIPFGGTSDVTVAMQPTAASRVLKRDHILDDFKTIVFDEGHHARAATWLGLAEHYKDAHVIGFSATPCRGDGKGLGNVFNHLVQTTTYKSLINKGYLVDCPLSRIYSWPVDMTGVRRNSETNDYIMDGKTGANRVMNQPKLVGNVVKHWQQYAQSRRTIVFSTNVAHATSLHEKFLEAGITAEVITGDTPREDRERYINSLKRNELKIIINHKVLTEGVDIPEVDCIVLARPTRMIHVYLQMVGRGLRTSVETGKKDLLLLDHVGAVMQLGLPTQDIQWQLKTDNISARVKEPSQIARELWSCPECGQVSKNPPCASCGHTPKPKLHDPDDIETQGYLERLDGKTVRNKHQRRKKRSKHGPSKNTKASTYRYLLREAAKRSYSPKWAAHRFKARFGTWPKQEWALPDPGETHPKRWYFMAARMAHQLEYKQGWAYHAFRNSYGKNPARIWVQQAKELIG